MTSTTGSRIRRSELTQDHRIDVAARLQMAAMDAIAKLHGQGPGLVFHGGTSIALMHGSPRWSEDLDFMAAPEAMAGIFDKEGDLARHLQFSSSLSTPGASTILARKKDVIEVGQVAKLNLRWEHPEFIGAVRIKIEFYITPQERLSSYAATPRICSFAGRQSGRKISGADIASIWADKIVAIAQRPALKHRDIHDLGYIAPLLDGSEDLDAALRASMGIYGRNALEISEGLARPLVTTAIPDRKAFHSDMERWFFGEEFQRQRQAGHYDRLHEAFLLQFEAGVSRVAALARDELGPGIEP